MTGAMSTASYTTGVVIEDVNDDGRPDLFLWSSGGRALLLHNELGADLRRLTWIVDGSALVLSPDTGPLHSEPAAIDDKSHGAPSVASGWLWLSAVVEPTSGGCG